MPALIGFALVAARPVPPTPPSETGAAAAVSVVRRYYAAIEARDYRAAYRLWPGRDTYARMKAGYADTAHVTVTPLPPFETEGGAGSSYCQVKVRVDAIRRGGLRRRYRGSFTLRRVNDIDGSTAAQRRWHIESATLEPA